MSYKSYMSHWSYKPHRPPKRRPMKKSVVIIANTD